MERWPRGLRQHPAKMLGEKSPRGFESLPLRHEVDAAYHFMASHVLRRGGRVVSAKGRTRPPARNALVLKTRVPEREP